MLLYTHSVTPDFVDSYLRTHPALAGREHHFSPLYGELS